MFIFGELVHVPPAARLDSFCFFSEGHDWLPNIENAVMVGSLGQIIGKLLSVMRQLIFLVPQNMDWYIIPIKSNTELESACISVVTDEIGSELCGGFYTEEVTNLNDK
ncbi:hypothetical protein ACLBWT_14400 [Paenibacillus sp. D51F]